MKLSEWAKANGASRPSACRWFRAGVLPVPAYQLSTGTILLEENEPKPGGVAVYARASSAAKRSDLDRQVARLAEHAAPEGLVESKVVSEIGSGLNGHRAKLLGLLRDSRVSTIVVEVADDLVRDMVEVLTSFCTRLYGRRFAKPGAAIALEAAGRPA
ncbi:MAG: recombinase family protein [Acidimicrobiales bacterium]